MIYLRRKIQEPPKTMAETYFIFSITYVLLEKIETKGMCRTLFKYPNIDYATLTLQAGKQKHTTENTGIN